MQVLPALFFLVQRSSLHDSGILWGANRFHVAKLGLQALLAVIRKAATRVTFDSTIYRS